MPEPPDTSALPVISIPPDVSVISVVSETPVATEADPGTPPSRKLIMAREGPNSLLQKNLKIAYGEMDEESHRKKW